MTDETTYTTQIITQIQENIDAFIIETIQPFCEETMQCELSKEDLKRACTLLLAERSGQIEARKPGKWIECDRDHQCTNCEGLISKYIPWYLDGLPNYCPFCGAKMEVENADSN